jgi:hypothetical protein
MKYKEANWDKIKKDLENTLTTITKRVIQTYSGTHSKMT